jgi:hypothetical protein
MRYCGLWIVHHDNRRAWSKAIATYSANEADSSIAIHAEGSSFPNWNGTEQKRFVTIAGDQLTLTVRPPTGDIVDVIWKRAK